MTRFLHTRGLLLGGALLALSGCYKATFYQNTNVVRGTEHDEWSDFFVFGLVGTEEFDVHKFCGGQPVAEVRTGSNVGTGIVTALTIGIYAPRKVYVTCAAGGGASARRLLLSADEQGVPVRAVVEDGRHRTVASIERVDDHTFHMRTAEVSP